MRLLIAATAALALSAVPLRAEEPQWRHAMSLVGEPKHEEGFAHYDHVNPEAPKGGLFRRPAIGTFDSLNPFILKGNPASGVTLIYEELMTRSLDEPSTEYGLIAEAAHYPDDYSSVTFRLNPKARWHDGKPITVEDVIFSFETIKKAHPQYQYYYKNVVTAEKTGEREVTFRFDETGNRELPQIIAELTIIPKHFWEGTDADGNKRYFLSTSLEPPLGSGAYRVKEVKAGRSISYERVPDAWAVDHPVNVGRNNFDEIRYEYFRDFTILLEGFKGDTFDLNAENRAQRWSQGYEFPAVKRGDVVRQEFATGMAEPMQAFILNTRQAKFSDPRVRRAFNYAFDFEWTKENIFFGLYKRTDSFFEKSELEATGLPKGIELEILDEIRDQVPPEVFTEEYENPVAGDKRSLRRNLKKAGDLLTEAGWTVQNGKRVNAAGEALSVEFLLVQPDMDRIINPYIRNLSRLGIEGTIRAVDVPQYRARLDSFDFDVTVSGFGQSLSPGNEQRDYWGSDAADRPGSRNTIGIKNPAIDHLIDRIIFSKSREELVAATHALDRVLLWNHYLVPLYHNPVIWTARWNRFGLPDKNSHHVGIDVMSWWYDEEKAAAIKGTK